MEAFNLSFLVLVLCDIFHSPLTMLQSMSLWLLLSVEHILNFIFQTSEIESDDHCQKEQELQKENLKLSSENIELKFQLEQANKDLPRLKVNLILEKYLTSPHTEIYLHYFLKCIFVRYLYLCDVTLHTFPHLGGMIESPLYIFRC